MYSKVVVPLDGSKLAEEALPHLEAIAKGCSIPEILLVSVTEKIKGIVAQSQAFEMPSNAPNNLSSLTVTPTGAGLVFSTHSSGMQEIPLSLGKMAKSAYDYLCKVAADLETRGFRTRINILMGKPADELVRFAEEQGADLIIMASRGKSGFSRWEMGNIAEKVIRATGIPVLLVKPGKDFKETKSKRKGVAI